MSKTIYKQWTIQSSNLEEFEKEINSNLVIGWKILDSSYNIIDNEKGNIYSQVLVWEDKEDIEIKFTMDTEYVDVKGGNEETTGNKLMSVVRTSTIDKGKWKGKLKRVKWNKDKFGEDYRKETMVYWYDNGQHVNIFYELLDENKWVKKLFEYNENGRKHGRYVNELGNLEGTMVNGESEREYFSFRTKDNFMYSGSFSHRNYFDHNFDERGGCSIWIFQSCLWTVLKKVNEDNPIESFLKEGENGELQLLIFRNSLSDDEQNTPHSFFDGQIIKTPEDSSTYSQYYIKHGRFVTFSETTRRRCFDIYIDDGSPDFIVKGNFVEYSYDTGEKLREGIIKKGSIKEEKEY